MNIADFRPTEPLPLHHSWPLFEMDVKFSLGRLHDPIEHAFTMATPHSAGQWECDLADDALSWSTEVYDLFGFPRDAYVTRADSLAVYAEESRSVIERLRAYAIRYRRGFTVDVALHPGGGAVRWMRLIGAPVCKDGRAVRLRGLKYGL